MSRRWLINPVEAMQARFHTLQHHLEQELEEKATGLPPVIPWAQRLTQVIILGIVGGVGWSIVARIDVVITATGKLEPMSQSQTVQAKSGGVIATVLVREGEAVKQNQLLIQMDKTSLYRQLQELLIQRNRLIKEIAVLRVERQGRSWETLGRPVVVSPELMNQVQMRRLLIAQLTGDSSRLSAEQRQRLDLYREQLRDRQSIGGLEESTLATRIQEAKVQQEQTAYQLEVEQDLLEKLEVLADEGAISRVSYLQRQVSVSDLQRQLTQNQLQTRQLEIQQLQNRVEERQTLNTTYQELQSQLAELDAKFDATIKENQQQLLAVNSSLNQLQVTLKNHDLRAPVDGIVFDLKPKLPGAVSQPGQALLQIVPQESLTAQIQVANADIANIRAGMPVDLRIDAYPFTEFGAVSGVISKVGSEAIALSPQANQPTTFPVEVRLNQQFLDTQGQRLPLTPGMSIAAMIKVRQRAPITYVTEEITKVFDEIQSVQ